MRMILVFAIPREGFLVRVTLVLAGFGEGASCNKSKGAAFFKETLYIYCICAISTVSTPTLLDSEVWLCLALCVVITTGESHLPERGRDVTALLEESRVSFSPS